MVRPEAMFDYNHQYTNDLPVTSPHGSDFRAIRKFLELHRFERSTRHSGRTPTSKTIDLWGDESLQSSRNNQKAAKTTIAIF